MKIDLHNYEAFFLDYKEGNLDESGVAELFAFLEEYPELKAELESFEEIVLAEDEIFAGKHGLKKREFDSNSLIAYTEGLLSPAEKQEIKALSVQNTAFAKELNYYASAKARPDESVKFPAKNKLKRGGVIFYLQANPALVRMAAALMLMLGLYFLFSTLRNDRAKEELPAVAKVQKNNVPVKEINSPGDRNARMLAETTPSEKAKNRDVHGARKEISTHQDSSVQANVRVVPSNTITVAENNVPEKSNDSAFVNPVAIQFNSTSQDNAIQSYINVSPDDEEEDRTTVTASGDEGRKSFFGRLTNAAKKVNELGLKRVNGEEEDNSKSIIIGGLVVSESSN